MYPRHIARDFREALEDTPVILVSGARQTGKSTLVRMYANAESYITFDDPALARAATEDPLGFVQSLPRPVILDEIQVVPDLFPAIKFEDVQMIKGQPRHTFIVVDLGDYRVIVK